MAFGVLGTDSYSGPATTQTTHNKNVNVPNGTTFAALFVASGFDASTGTITATLGGAAMTVHATRARLTSARGTWLYKINPTTGASVACNVTAATGVRAAWGIVFFGQSDTSTPAGADSQADGSSGAPAVNGIASATGEIVLHGVATNSASTVDLSSWGAGQTQQVNVESNSGGGGNAMICGISTKDGAASVNVSATLSSGAAWASIGFSVKPGSAPPPSTNAAYQGVLRRRRSAA